MASPSRRATRRSIVEPAVSAARISCSRSSWSSRWVMSVSGRPQSVGIRLNRLAAGAVKLRMRRSIVEKDQGDLGAVEQVLRSLLAWSSCSSLRDSSALTVFSSSLTDCSSSLLVSSSSLVDCSSSLSETSSSLEDFSSSTPVSCSSRTDCSRSRVSRSSRSSRSSQDRLPRGAARCRLRRARSGAPTSLNSTRNKRLVRSGRAAARR